MGCVGGAAKSFSLVGIPNTCRAGMPHLQASTQAACACRQTGIEEPDGAIAGMASRSAVFGLEQLEGFVEGFVAFR